MPLKGRVLALKLYITFLAILHINTFFIYSFFLNQFINKTRRLAPLQTGFKLSFLSFAQFLNNKLIYMFEYICIFEFS